jgi:hypothetical protein
MPASNDGHELVDAGYTRQVVPLTVGPDGTYTNGARFTFGPFANDVTVQGVAIYDATTNGNMLLGGVMGEPMSFSAGESMVWSPQHLWVRLL